MHSRNSPRPLRAVRISVSPAAGQPPPGKASSSRVHPVPSVVVRAALRPRQMAGCSSNRSSVVSEADSDTFSGVN